MIKSRTRPVLEVLEERTLLATAFIRLNQVGYVAGEARHALLMASVAEDGAQFQVLNSSGQTVYSASIGALLGSWTAAYPDVYLLDFSSASLAAGKYSITVTGGAVGAKSPPFRIGTATNFYSQLLANALFFYQSQHDGPDVNSAVMGRQPSHLTDETASIYSTPAYSYSNGSWYLTSNLANLKLSGTIDVSGGWFDAGDYLKFVETASYTDAIMLLAARAYPSLLGPSGVADFLDEGKYGLDWLLKMWDDSTQTLYYQVGIGDGNKSQTIMGDHDVNFRLPQADDALGISSTDTSNPEYYIEYRPVLRAGPPASPVSPMLAGRLAADFALGFQLFQVSDPAYANQCLFAAEHVFDLAKTASVPSYPLTATPGGANGYYPEQSWQDDLELGATELYFAVAKGNLPAGLPHTDPGFYLQKAASWAKAYINWSANNGSEPLNLYDVSGLAHYELYNAITQAGNPTGLAVSRALLLNNLGQILNAGVNQAKLDPFGFGIAYNSGLDLVPHALGYALEASLYDRLANATTYAAFGNTQLDWVLGNNPFGSSFIVGAGTLYPHSLQSQIANLYVSSSGTMVPLLGTTVDGPSTTDLSGLTTPPGAKPSGPSWAANPFRKFDGHGVEYWDNVASWPTVEPADDYAALTILDFALQIDGPPTPAATSPAIPAPAPSPRLQGVVDEFGSARALAAKVSTTIQTDLFAKTPRKNHEVGDTGSRPKRKKEDAELAATPNPGEIHFASF
jgi:endoglucanase